jgi:hypothetical protein
LGLMPLIYHVTPVTPRSAFRAIMPGRAAVVSFYRPDDVDITMELCPRIFFDNGAYSEWQAALNRGQQWFIREDWSDYYAWLETRLFQPGRWAVIPDAPGAPSQLNDALVQEWPFGRRGAPLWHMDGPIERLLRLLERFDRVCFGWVGEFDPSTGKIRKDQRSVDCPAFHDRMEEVAKALGNTWPEIHMMRGAAVAFDYPFGSADTSSLGKNGHDYDSSLDFGDPWRGRRTYADTLESGGIRPGMSRPRRAVRRARGTLAAGSLGHEPADQLGLW